MTHPTPPRILILGRESGKTWMRSVVFERKSPLDLVLLDRRPQNKIHITQVRNTLCIDVWDFPSDVNLSNDDYKWFLPYAATEAEMWKTVGAIVYVFDAQEDLRPSQVQDVHNVFRRARSANPNVALEVFINKVDGDEFALEDSRSEAYQRFQKQLAPRGSEDAGFDFDSISYHLTSVYNPSIFEAWSLVVQKIFVHQSTISALIDAFIEAVNVEKVFLFDTSTRLHVATDYNPVDQQTLMLCAEALDVVGDLERIYLPAHKAFDGDRNSLMTIRLSHDLLLYARQVGFRLALVCVLRRDAYTQPKLFESNVSLFTLALHKILQTP